MKEFCFWDEDDLSNLPPDFKLVPFNVEYIDPSPEQGINETPKTLTSKRLLPGQKPSAEVRPELSNQTGNN